MKSLHVISLTVVAIVLVMSCSLELVHGQERSLAQLESIKKALEDWYQQWSFAKNFKTYAGCITSEAEMQSKKNHWPRKVLRVLQVATGVPTSSIIDMKEVARVASGLKQNNHELQQEFLNNIKGFLSRTFTYKYKLDDLDEFDSQKNELCGSLRSDHNYNFEHAINELILSTLQENVYHEHFIENRVDTDNTFGPLYSASLFCRFIDAIPGAFGESNREFRLDLPKNIDEVIGYWPYK